MRYIRLDYVITFFIIYIIVSVVREIYIRSKLEKQDYTKGYEKCLSQISVIWNYGVTEKLNDEERLTQLLKHIKGKYKKLNSGIAP